mmetsp:Transcript_458/g.1394  ORF Transcript_458/g.1394 Transcript_458/m.1394 type:complete len:246 (+) Transcript_458:147-884(+)
MGPRGDALWRLELAPLLEAMMKYPQDPHLQQYGMTRLAKMLNLCDRAERTQAFLRLHETDALQVTINAIEVHLEEAIVQAEAASFLRAFASYGGTARGSIVAAGALPAVCLVLQVHKPNVDVIVSVCRLCAELCSRRDAPPGSRRALASALATTGVLQAAIAALLLWIGEERVVAPVSEIVLACVDEFAGGSAQHTPLELQQQLRESALLAALATTRHVFVGNHTIELAAAWAAARTHVQMSATV